jgi:hypothetical protein
MEKVLEIGEGNFKIIKKNHGCRCPGWIFIDRFHLATIFNIKREQDRSNWRDNGRTFGKSRNWFQRNRLETFNPCSGFSEDVNRNWRKTIWSTDHLRKDKFQWNKPMNSNFKQTWSGLFDKWNLGFYVDVKWYFINDYNLNNHSYDFVKLVSRLRPMMGQNMVSRQEKHNWINFYG